MSDTKRKPLFDRDYDFDNGTSEITNADGTESLGVVSLADVPEAMVKRFALAGITNFILNSAASASKRKENALSLADGIADAYKRVQAGLVDLGARQGAGDLTATGLLGRALLALGRNRIEFGGQGWDFSDEASAKAAAKALYNDKREVTFTNASGRPVTLSSRQFFRALLEQPAVAAKVAEFRASKAIDLGIEF